ncbi:helix-turn-helix domain-containing protein [Saccharicrinis sp. FJH2]|uniref:AraC family transcriptional regulator n=1 Tax=Saccharicrinis sp. FJH65 TaxID=3344659 RepID=UPI0035F48FAF
MLGSFTGGTLNVIHSIEIEEGKYWEVQPSLPLRSYIRKYYFTEGFSAYKNIDIHPVGKESIEMHFHYGSNGFDVFDFQLNDFKERRAYVVGNQPFDKLYKTRIIEELAMLSVEFTNLGVLCLLHCSPVDLYEHIPDVDDAFGPAYKHLLKQILEAKSYMDKLRVVELFFMKTLNPDHGLQPNEKDILKYLDDNECNTVDEICSSLGISHRTVERVFASRLGLRPKEYLRIKRLNKACEMLINYPEISISDIINDCNYYDQSHFIREFRNLIKKSPLKYLKDVNGLFYFGRGYVL